MVLGDAKIDTSKVDSTLKIDEYDEETQGQIRRIMFDQAEKREGRPTSDELRGVGKEMEDLMKQVPPPPSK